MIVTCSSKERYLLLSTINHIDRTSLVIINNYRLVSIIGAIYQIYRCISNDNGILLIATEFIKFTVKLSLL